MSAQKFNVAIDGPAGAGKSTAARMAAARLGFVYVDTGAMYRAVTWKAIELGLSLDDKERIVEMARRLELALRPSGTGQQVFADGRDITENLRSAEVNRWVSDVAQIREIRAMLAARQQELAARRGVVMDGRDIGSKVLPDAEVKIFLTATAEARARRRFEEMREKGEQVDFEKLKQDIALRDRMDEQRAVSPLVMAEDAVLVESTEMTLRQVVERILDICREKCGLELGL